MIDNQTYYISTLTQTLPPNTTTTGLSNQVDTGEAAPPTGQVMMMWTATLNFVTSLPAPKLSVDVGMWVQLTNPKNRPNYQTQSFYKDPEMEMDNN